MSRYRVPRILTACDAAYIAGLIDGEGTITLSRRHARDERQVVVSIANTERPLLEFVSSAIGAGKITGKRVTSDLHSPSFCYSLSNRQALLLLRQILPYLRSYKHERAKLILGKYVLLTPRNGKYSEALRNQRRSFEQELLAIKPGRAPTRRNSSGDNSDSL